MITYTNMIIVIIIDSNCSCGRRSTEFHELWYTIIVFDLQSTKSRTIYPRLIAGGQTPSDVHLRKKGGTHLLPSMNFVAPTAGGRWMCAK